MPQDPIALRYTAALFAAATEGQVVEDTLGELETLTALLRAHPDLGVLLRNPDLEPNEKLDVLDRVLRGRWSELVKTFVHMVLTLGRAEQLAEMHAAFRQLVDEATGQLRVTVRSVHPLSGTVLTRLRTRLEAREGKRVALHAEQDARLLGGVQLVLGHRVFDGSVQRQLGELRQRLKAIRVT